MRLASSRLRVSAVVLTLLLIIAGFVFAPHARLEALFIGKGVSNFQELSDRFATLAKEKGPLYAYDVLRRADVPPGTDFHLLGHVIGDELYRQLGIDGIVNCTADFRNACSHSIVIGAVAELGPDAALPMMRDACRKAPGGSGAYTMCTHGIGHGIFAYYGYTLEPTVAQCRALGTAEYGNREYTECVGGAIMELMGGGGHDTEAWVKSRETYLDPRDPLAPCSSTVIPRDVKDICYTYLTPHLFTAAGGDLDHPGPTAFIGAFRLCDRISREEPDLRKACFSGVGKEFTALALKRDIRKINSAPADYFERMYEWCGLAPHEEARTACIRSIVQSLFWGGENEPMVSVRFCAAVSDDAGARECYEQLYEEAGRYWSSDSTERDQLCVAVPASTEALCRDKLNV